MVNNVGKTTTELNGVIGQNTIFAPSTFDTITTISGELGVGYLLFDEKGTLGVMTEYNFETGAKIETRALSIDIESILGGSY